MCQRDALHSTDVNMLIFRNAYPTGIDTIIIINTKVILFIHCLGRAFCVQSRTILYQSDTFSDEDAFSLFHKSIFSWSVRDT